MSVFANSIINAKFIIIIIIYALIEKVANFVKIVTLNGSNSNQCQPGNR